MSSLYANENDSNDISEKLAPIKVGSTNFKRPTNHEDEQLYGRSVVEVVLVVVAVAVVAPYTGEKLPRRAVSVFHTKSSYFWEPRAGTCTVGPGEAFFAIR